MSDGSEERPRLRAALVTLGGVVWTLTVALIVARGARA